MSDALNLLIGAATVRLRTDDTLSVSDRDLLLNLIGLVSARVFEARIAQRLDDLGARLSMIERDRSN